MSFSPASPHPERFTSEASLDDYLTTPSPALIESIRGLPGPLVLLGAGGKMGPTLALLARRAAQAAQHPLEIIAVSRFSNADTRIWLEQHDIKTMSRDLLDPSQVRRLPDASDVVSLVGLKFGTAQDPATTWAINTLVPVQLMERYPSARVVALSTGNVYPLGAVGRQGSVETDSLTPLGEYSNAAVARERLFSFAARPHSTRVCLLRLFYAVDLRYGVPVDIAHKVFQGEPIDLTNGYFNCIWQGDANEMVLRSFPLAASPPSAWNLCRPEIYSVREVATVLGGLMGRTPRFTGAEAANALLGNAQKICAVLGTPAIGLDTMLSWIARWVESGGRSLAKPTHFEVRDGAY